MKYVISELGSEYNDETYDISDFGKPVAVLDDMETAKLKLEELNALYFQGLEIHNYCYSMDDVCDYEWDILQKKLLDISDKFVFEEDNENWITVPETLDLDQLKQVAKIFKGLKFYSVCEVKE